MNNVREKTKKGYVITDEIGENFLVAAINPNDITNHTYSCTIRKATFFAAEPQAKVFLAAVQKALLENPPVKDPDFPEENKFAAFVKSAVVRRVHITLYLPSSTPQSIHRTNNHG